MTDSFSSAAVPTIKPQPQQERFLELHHSHLARANEGPVDLLFIGDSIIFQWERHQELWEQNFGHYSPANFGIAGDTTQQVLWRIENGALDGIDPRVVVLLIGTNNSGSHSAEQISFAIDKIVYHIQKKLPETRILLLGIFPRGPRNLDADGIPQDDGIARMEVVRAVNQALAGRDDGDKIRFLDIGEVFLERDGTISEAIMYDQLHLTSKGYQRWAKAMQPLLSDMMKQ